MKVVAMGTALPDKTLTNEDLTQMMETSDEWIFERTGIRERRIGGSTSSLGLAATRDALDRSGIDPATIEQVVLATTTPDYMMPGTAPAIAHELGLTCGAFDVQAVCSGWVYGLVVVNGMLQQGVGRILLIGSETMERMTDYHDRGTGILFGNGAGAVIIDRDPSNAGRLLGWDLGSNGKYVHILYAEHGENMKMDGREVFRQAVTVMQESASRSLERAGLAPADIDLVVPHQANVRIVDAAWRKIGFSMENTAMILDRTGNTSSASIPLAFNEALINGRVSNGDKIMFLGFGAGMTWASAIVEWNGVTT